MNIQRRDEPWEPDDDSNPLEWVLHLLRWNAKAFFTLGVWRDQIHEQEYHHICKKGIEGCNVALDVIKQLLGDDEERAKLTDFDRRAVDELRRLYRL